MKRTKNPTAKIEPKLNRSENSPRSRKSKRDHSRDERIEKKKKSFLSESFTQDIIDSSQSSVVPRKKSRSNNCNSGSRIAGSLTTELLEPASSGEPRFRKLALNSPESCLELGKKGSGDCISESIEKKDRQKRRIPFIVDSENQFNQDYDMIETEKFYYQTHVEPNHTNHDDNRKKSKSEVKHRSSWDMSFPDFLSPIGKQHTDDAETEPGMLKKDRKHRRREKVEKKITNTLLAMIHGSSSSSDSNDEIQKIDDCSIATLNKGNTRKHNKSIVSQILSTSVENEESHSSNTKHVRKFISNLKGDETSDNHQSENQENERDCSRDNQQGCEFVKAIRSTKSPADTASDCSLLNIPIENVETEPNVFRKYGKHKAADKVRKKKANTLLAMIHGSSSSSDTDDEIQQIDDCSIVTPNKENPEKHNKSRVNQTSTSNEKEESHSSKTRRVRKCIPSSTSSKTTDNRRSESRESDKEFPQDNEQGFEFVRAMKSEKLPADTASDCGLPNISPDIIVKTQPDLIEKFRKHKAKEKVKKKKANTLLAMIHDSASSTDLNDEIKKIDHSSEESVDKVNSRKSTKSRVSEIFDEEKGDEASSEQSFKNSSAMSPKFSLEAEAKDINELISAMEEEEQIPDATVARLLELRIRLKHTVSPQHQVETRAGSRGPTPRQKKIIEKFGPIKYGKFAPEEDDVIVNNWKSFCKLHDWDPSDVKPFLYMRHQNVGLIAKLSERHKFVQFLADGLPWRTLYSVYWRFRILYQPRLQTKYTDDEDRLIIAHMENSSAKKNVRKFSELGKILNRTRASVWRRYRLLQKKRDPHEKLKWSLHLVKKVIKNLMQLTLSNDVCQLKDLDIPLVVWKKLSKKFKIDNTDLKQFWLKKLHMQLFCQEPVYLNDVKIKLIEYFHATGISESWEIEWPSVAKHFDGMTPIFLSRIFGSLTRNKKYEGMALGEIIEHLYEVKKPELQKARKDKCLPRVVFKDGNVKLLDVKVNNGSKRKTVKSEDLSD